LALLLVIAMVSGAWKAASAEAKTVTSTAMTVTSVGHPVTTVSAGTVVTLTATVNAGATALETGQVSFCDATAKYCTDIHLLGTAQLTSAGTATLKFRPAIGSHRYKAVFLGTNSNGSSVSSAAALAVTGKFPTMTTISQAGIPGAYTLTATVAGIVNSAGIPAPTGSVSFVDTTSSNSVLGNVAVSSGTAGLSFSGSLFPVTGPEGMGIATADFNEDGIPDLALGAPNDGITTLSILLGNGDGTFTAVASNPAVGHYPYSLVAGDFNGDGIPDLAVGNVEDNNVSILLGKGDGTFIAKPNLNTGSAPQSLAAGDFNGDGIPDLAVVAGSSVLVFLGNGEGTFQQAAASLSTGSTLPQGIAAGDLNGDGIADLVVANDAESGSVIIFFGNGDGTFKSGYQISGTGAGTISVAIADFNRDGIPDLAVTNYSDDSVSILLGNGNGTFQTAVSYTLPLLNLQSVTAADFNGDGIVDLAIGSGYPASVAILPGNGDGTFGAPVYADVNSLYPSGFLAVADFNGDGLSDIAEPDQLSSNVAIFLNQQSETVTATLNNVNPPGPGPHLIEANYPGDSNFTASSSGTTSLTSVVAVPAFSLASGTYSSAQALTITDATPGATIYYLASGPISTTGFVAYTGPISLNLGGVETIEAYATETGYQQSNYTTATYTLNLPAAPAPVISPLGGSYANAQTITITDAAPGATIYYTTNGTYPMLGSTKYTGPITVSTSETVAAIAIASGYSTSNSSSAQYIINSSSSSFIYTVAGNTNPGYSGDGGLAPIADLNNPSTSVVDLSGNLYIADSGNNVVRKVAAGTGIISTIAGKGIAGYSGDGGPATSAQLDYPYGLALDGAGNLYISDTGNYRIRKITTATGIITTYAGNGSSGSTGDGGPATSAEFIYPRGVAIDRSGNLFITDSLRIREVAAASGVITTVAGNGNDGYSGDGGPAINASFQTPSGVAVDGYGNLYIADTWNNAIRKVTASTGIISTVAGNPMHVLGGGGEYSGDGGPATSAYLYHPLAVTLDTAGDLYIADTYNQAIRKVAASNGYISTVAGDGPYGVCSGLGGDGGTATSASICYPYGVTVDGAGNLYIAETYNNRIREATAPATPPTGLTSKPVFSVAAGTYASPQTVTLSDSTPGSAVYVTLDGSSPNTVSQGYNGPINVTGTVTIKAVAAAPGFLPSAPVSAAYRITSSPAAVISTVAGNGGSGFAGAGGPATQAQIGYPRGIAFGGNGNLYFSDSANNVVWMKAAKTGDVSVIAGNGVAGYAGDGGPATSAQLSFPQGIAVDGAGNIYIADSTNNVIRMVAAASGIITTFAGNGKPNYDPQSVGDGGPATSAELYDPVAVALDKKGNLYIADEFNNRVRMVTANTGIITTVAGDGNYGFSGDGGPATSASVDGPNAVAFDTAGNLYVATQFSGRIRKLTAATGTITTVAGNGTEGGSGDGGPATSAEIAPFALAVDSAGNIYFSNPSETVRVIDANTGAITLAAGNGYYGYSGDGDSATVAELRSPLGIAFDSSGDLFIADSGNSRVRELRFGAGVSAATPVFTPPAGTYIVAQSVTITDATPGAAIYYTTDGTIPSTRSSLYSGAITVSATTTLQAIAVAPGSTASSVAIADYTIDLLVAPKVMVSASSTSITAAQTLTVMVTIAGPSGSPTPTGTVTLSSSGYTLASTPLSGGSTTINIPAGSLSVGNDTLTAAYSGDSNYSGATTSFTETVTSGPNFEHIAGSLVQISVGADGSVWGINSAEQIFTYNPHSGGWTQIPGSLNQIAVGSGSAVWGINAWQQIYRWDFTHNAWDQIPGALVQIAVGADGDVWGINAVSGIFHYNQQTQSWNQVPGSLNQIAVGSAGVVYGVNLTGQLFWYNPGSGAFQYIPGSSGFTRLAVGVDGDLWTIANSVPYHYDVLHETMTALPGSLVQIVVGSGASVFGLNAAGQIFQWQAQSGTWLQIPGALSSIAVGANGALWGINPYQQIFQLAGAPTRPFQTLNAVSGKLNQISVGADGSVWGVSSNTVEHFNTGTQTFTPATGAPALAQVSVGAGADVWGVNASGSIYHYVADTGTWNNVPGTLSSVQVGADGEVWGINPVGQPFTYNFANSSWDNIPGVLSTLSVGADGTVWGINSFRQIFRFDIATQSWINVPGYLTQVSVGNANNIWGVNAYGQVFQYNPESPSWNEIPNATLSQVWVTFDGAVWGVNAYGQLFRWNAATQAFTFVGSGVTNAIAGNAAAVWATNPTGALFSWF
jgi:hypothetical protein